MGQLIDDILNLSRLGRLPLESETVSRYIDLAGKQVRSLTRLIQDMLDIAKIQNGKLAIKLERRDLSLVVHDVFERFASEFKALNRKISLHLEDGLEAYVDPFRLGQVLSNLLTNAIKYAPASNVEVRLVRIAPSRAQISVKDFGSGIDPVYHEKIFNRFERCISANEVSGLGLGLYIVRQIVEAHHGRIWVESVPGYGAEFIVELPLVSSA